MELYIHRHRWVIHVYSVDAMASPKLVQSNRIEEKQKSSSTMIVVSKRKVK